jgi:CIC family chloride channel protein
VVATAARRLALALIAPALVGAVTGALVAALSGGIEGRVMAAVAALPDAWPALVTAFALPLAVLAAVAVTRTLRPSTSELYIVTYHTPGAHVPLRQVPGRILAAIATVGLGGSQGFESPSARSTGSRYRSAATSMGLGWCRRPSPRAWRTRCAPR